MKKLIFVIMTILLSLNLLSCKENNDNVSLEKHRTMNLEKVTEILNRKSSNDYSEQNWSDILEIVEIGKTKIQLAESIKEIDLLTCNIKLNIESVVPIKVDQINNGVFVLANDSWELYVRKYARDTNKDEKWIQEVIRKGADENENFLYPRETFRAVIVNNQITVTRQYDVPYQLSLKNNIYVGSTANKELQLWILKDDLYIYEGNEPLHLIRDMSYQTENIISKKLDAPKNVRYSGGGEGYNYFTVQWDYRADYGTLGGGVEVKTSQSQEFRLIDIEQPYMNTFVIQLNSTNFTLGENFVQIYHLGGPVIQNDKKIVLFEKSDFITFMVRISDESVEIFKI